MNQNPSARQLRDLPPRNINLFTKATVLFGGFMQQFGWIFFCMGSLFSWIFIPMSTVRYWFEFGKEWQQVPGKIISAEPTNSSVNEQPVYQYLQSFEVNGQRYTGKSFSVGPEYQGGEEVTIEYDANNPSDSHVEGARRAVFPAFVLFVLIFPIVGGVFIFIAIRQNLKAIKLLEIGEFTRGTMCSKEATNSTVTINNQRYPVFKYSFEFQAGGRTHSAICKTHQAWLVEDEEREIILYDKYNPDYNVVFDAAGNMPEITEAGLLATPGIGKVVYLILPMVGIGMNLFFLFFPLNLMG
ncbi:MAG: DUF3592 domain-containing protein [Saprospiraceae bacterium]|nr:DUF3592 domain-containing protein [Saprospiraceae bacterium]MCF8252166.1 DUF3592 domain-containing protein [Saprospiraceae bacterium]MCF8281581.1 DUF3592 domain-containing protein [Bacteroidales bacterium]MCF8313835.1 DUF3592 domain-containing protein [Saprospiraceae bacterium]MCF8442573.1 DUF3592 domain-containing protein [Saprospiraceae bacterium]